MSFTLNTKIPMPRPEERNAILGRMSGVTMAALQDLLGHVSDRPPKEWTCGVLVGYLRAKGYSWSEALTAMDEYLKVSGAVTAECREFKLEAIICSVGCAEFLKSSLERNMRHFNRTLVVTDEKDLESRKVAQSMGADVMVSNRFYLGGQRFDRGSVYNRALKELKYGDWVAFMDVDIILPGDFRARLNAHGLKPDCFYGMPRHDIHGADQRAAFLKGQPFKSQPHEGDDWGFGYFQLFCMKSRFVQGLSVIYPGAEDVNHSDYLFRKQFGADHTFDAATGIWTWDPVYQIRLPFHCYHIGADAGEVPSLTRHYPNPHNLPSLSCPPKPLLAAAFSPSLVPPAVPPSSEAAAPLTPG